MPISYYLRLVLDFYLYLYIYVYSPTRNLELSTPLNSLLRCVYLYLARLTKIKVIKPYSIRLERFNKTISKIKGLL